MAEPVKERQVHLMDYWQVIVRRRWILYSTLLLVTGLTTLGSFLVRPIYTATAQLQIEKSNPNVLPFQEVAATYTDWRDDFYETQSRVIQSRSVARAVVKGLGLAKHPLFELPSSKEPLSAEEVELLLADMIRAGTKVTLIRNSRLADVTYQSPDPRLAADVANALAESYISFNSQAAYNTTERATESIARQIETLRNEIGAQERALQAYAREQEIIPLDEKQNVTTQKLNDLNVAYTKAQTARIEKEARWAALKETPPEAIPELMVNDLLQTLAAKHADLEREYARMSKRFKEDWPALARLKTELERTRERLDAEKEDLHKRLVGAAREQYLAAFKEEQALGEALDAQKSAAQEAGLRAIEYDTLKSEIANRRKTLDSLVKRQAETGTTAVMLDQPLSNIRVVDRAEVPRFPSSPRKGLNFLLSLIAGLGLGVGLAFFFDYMDDSISAAEDLRAVADVGCLGLIPAHDRQARRLRLVRGQAAAEQDSRPEIDLATLRDPRSPASEAFRELRTALLVSSPGRAPRLLMVTSAQPREGKTSTALNLAVTLTQLGRKVLVVDADLRRPRLQRALGISADAGLSNLLSGGGSLPELVVPAGAPGLYALPSGPIPPNPAELLDSPDFTNLTRRLAEDPSWDHVIFDTPPIGSVTDAATMAPRMDGVILVVRAGSTPRAAIARAAEKLRVVNARILGALLNQVDHYHGGYYHEYVSYKPVDGETLEAGAGSDRPSRSRRSRKQA